MFEGRMKEYRQGLIDDAKAYFGPGEDARVLALSQVGVPPWVTYVPYGIGAAGVGGGFTGGYLPSPVAIALILIAVAGVFATTRIARRMLVRTDEHLYVFALPSSSKASLEPPLAVYAADEIPVEQDGGAPRLDGAALYPGYGASGEKEAIALAVGPGSAL